MGDKLPKLTAKEAESLLLQNGFVVDRQKGSHKIYKKDSKRMVLPHHIGKTENITPKDYQSIICDFGGLAKKAQDSTANTAELQSQIDSLVYELYGLDSSQIDIRRIH